MRDAREGNRQSAILASVYAWTGDKDRALPELARLLCTPGGWNQRSYGMSVNERKFGPDFFPLRGDPRFAALRNDSQNSAPLV